MSKQLSAFAVYNKQAKKKTPVVTEKKTKQEFWEINDVEDSDLPNVTKKKTKQKQKDFLEINNVKDSEQVVLEIKSSKTRNEKRKRKRKNKEPNVSVSASSKKHKVSLKRSDKLKGTSRDAFISTDVVSVEDDSDSDSDVPVLIDTQINGSVETDSSLSEFATNDNNVEENSFDVSKNVLNFLLAPIGMEDFFENYWEKRPLHVSRKNSNYFRNLLTSESLDKMLRENPLYYTRNVDVVTYENDVKLMHNPEGRATPASVWDYYSNGCSVRILNPQTYSRKVHTLLATLQEYFGTMVGANVYLTPHGSQGFAPHYDDIEAFVLQLEGRKHWKIYSPRSESEILPRFSSSNFRREDLSYPLSEITVEAGDLLYFPRGFIHEASTDNEAHSLHITVSVYQNTAYIDLLEKILPEALKIAARDDVEFRQGLPLHYLRELGAANVDKPSALREIVSNTVQRLMLKLTNHAPIDWAVDQMGRKFMYDAMPPVLSRSEKNRSSRNDGEHLANGVVENRAEFGLDTKVRLVRFHSLRLTLENDGSAKLYYCTENANTYHGEEEQSLEIDIGMFDVVQALVRNYPNYISIEDMPNQNETEKLNVISDLWEKGLIITKECLDICDD